MIDIFFNKLRFTIPLGIVLSLVLQSIFLFAIKDNPNIYLNGNFVPLWTHDAGLYGFYAKKLLSGAVYPFSSEYMGGWLLYGLVKITPFSIDQIIFFAPTFFSCLVIIPIVGIFNLFKLQKVGFFAGVLTTISLGYYYRSFFGYYDTDILNLFFPLLIIWGLIGFSYTKCRFYALLGAFSMLGFSLWYHSYIAIGAGIAIVWVIYTIAFERDNLINYLIFLMLIVPFFNIDIWIKITIILLLFASCFQRFFTRSKYLPFIFIAFVLMASFFTDIEKIYQRANQYISKSTYIKSSDLSFINTLNTVLEANSISFEKFTNLVTPNIFFALIALFGFILLSLAYRQFLLLLPLGFIGFLSLVAGERFVLYGVVIFSFGIVYFLYKISFGFSKYKHQIFLALLGVTTLFYLWDIIQFSKTKKPIFNSSEIQVLHKIPKNKDNFILTWWDYGWPLWYETGAQTLIDNGKHFEDNFIISKLLFSTNQTFVANASKQSVKLFKEARKNGSYKLMPYLLKNKTPNQALSLLAKPTQTKIPIYWYLNKNLLWIGNSIELFSNIDLKTKKQKNKNIMVYLKNSNSVKFDKNSGILLLNGQKFNIQSYTNLEKKEFKTYKGIDLHYIQMDTHFFICTSNIYNSFLVQALIFHRVDKNLFQIISYDKNSIILKVK